jgi:hypothetical protein
MHESVSYQLAEGADPKAAVEAFRNSIDAVQQMDGSRG